MFELEGGGSGVILILADIDNPDCMLSIRVEAAREELSVWTKGGLLYNEDEAIIGGWMGCSLGMSSGEVSVISTWLIRVLVTGSILLRII